MRLSWEKAALMKYFELHVSFVIKTANFTANYLIITIISIQAPASHKQKKVQYYLSYKSKSAACIVMIEKKSCSVQGRDATQRTRIFTSI